MKARPDDHSDEVEFTTEDRISMVKGAIIGALAGGHMDGNYRDPQGASYSKSVLLQIADLLGFLDQIPENVKDGTFRQQFTLTINKTNE